MSDTQSCNSKPLSLGRWACGQRVFRVAHKPTGQSVMQRPAAEPATLGVDEAEFDIGVAHAPVATGGLFDPDRFADQHLADEDQVPTPLDLAVGADPPHLAVPAIVGLAQGAGVGPWRRPVKRRRILEAQGFVRPFTVVDPAEAVEARLLLGQACRRRLGRVVLERAMHALMPAVLLRLGRLDPLRPDSKLDPPQRQCRQPARRRRGKGRSVVRADRPRQAELAERLIEDRPHMRIICTGHLLAAQQIAAHRIAQCQRIAARPIAGAEPALEVHRPHRVGLVGRRKRLAVGRTAWPPTPLDRQVAPGQPVADRARRRQLDIRTQLTELVAQLLGTPAVVLAQRQHIVHQLGLSRAAVMMRSPAAILQTLDPFRVEARQQPVPGVSADAVLRADLRHHRPFFSRRNHKTHPFVHDTGLFPRHRQNLLPSIENLSAMYPVHSVSYLSGPYPHLASPPGGGEEHEGGETEDHRSTSRFQRLVQSSRWALMTSQSGEMISLARSPTGAMRSSGMLTSTLVLTGPLPMSFASTVWTGAEISVLMNSCASGLTLALATGQAEANNIGESTL